MNYERLYEYRLREIDQGAREAVWREVASYVYEQLGRPRRVLDPAAGLGEFIGAIPAEERWAVDVAAHEGGDLRGATTSVLGDVMTVDLPRDYFDAVFVSNFLEHLPDQETIATFLGRMREVLRDGGRIAVLGPNFRYSAKEYFDFADHTVPLTHVAVAEHLHTAGFEVESVRARFLPFSFKSRLPASAKLTRLYLRAPLAWRLLGKQFFVVGKK